MKVNFKLLILLLLLVAPVAMFAQADTTNTLEGLEFTDGTISPDSLSFEESPDTATVKADSAQMKSVAGTIVDKAGAEGKKSCLLYTSPNPRN